MSTRPLPSSVVNGSFVTTKPDPNDLDLILVMPPDWDLQSELTPDVYNLLSKKRVRKRFGFDILVACERAEQYREYLALFQAVRGQQGVRKGVLQLCL